MKKILNKIKNYKFPYKIIKTKDYEFLKQVEEEYIKLCDEKNIEPTNLIEELIFASPIMNFGRRMLLRMIKDKKGE